MRDDFLKKERGFLVFFFAFSFVCFLVFVCVFCFLGISKVFPEISRAFS